MNFFFRDLPVAGLASLRPSPCDTLALVQSASSSFSSTCTPRPACRPAGEITAEEDGAPPKERAARSDHQSSVHHSSGTRLACPVTLWITTSSMAPFSELTSSINEFSPRGERRGERADRLHSVTFRDGEKLSRKLQQQATAIYRWRQ